MGEDMVDLTWIVRVADPQPQSGCLNPYEAHACAAARTILHGEMHVASPGRVFAPFAPKRVTYGPFRFGEVYG